MAGQINQSALQAKIQGLREAKAAFQALPEVMRRGLLDATETTLSEIVRHARANLESSPSIETRNLWKYVNFTLNKNSGRGRAGVSAGSTTITVAGRRIRVKGVVVSGKGDSALTAHGARRIKPSRYAHLVERGTRHSPAEPFMLPAAKSQEKPYLDRCRHAGKKAEQELANIGMRHL